MKAESKTIAEASAHESQQQQMWRGDPALGFTADVSLFSSFPQVANTPEPQV